MNTITIEPSRYKGALQYAQRKGISVQDMVVTYLLSFPVASEPQKSQQKLPAHLEKLCGILKGAEEIKGDDRLDYILRKG